MWVRSACAVRIAAALFLLAATTGTAHAQLDTESGTIDVDLIVEGCNNNLVCEAVIGETTATCPLDCPIPTPDPDPVSEEVGSSPGSHRQPSVPTPATTQGSELAIEGLAFKTTATSLSVGFSTKTQSIASLRIGTTALYEQAAVAEFGYRFVHELRAESLQPGTRYQYELRVVDAGGASYVTRGAITTDGTAPVLPNTSVLMFTPTVSGLRAEPTATGVEVAWNLYDIGTGASVQIVRTVDVPARQPTDGTTIYEGRGASIFDTGVVDNAQYVYTVFVRDAAGAIVGTTHVSLPYAQQRPPFSLDTFEPVFTNGALEVMSIAITQDDQPVPWEQKKIILTKGKKTLFSLPKQSFFAPLKHHQLVVTLYDEQGGFISEQYVTLSFVVRTQTYETLLELAPDAHFVSFSLTRTLLDGMQETVRFAGVVVPEEVPATETKRLPPVLLGLLWIGIAGILLRLVFRILLSR